MGMTVETWSVLQLSRFIRDLQLLHILNTQTPTQLIKDIYYERVNACSYNFFIDYAYQGKIVDRLFFSAFYNIEQYQKLIDFRKTIRKPLAWKRILKLVKPSALTIHGPYLFKKYDKFYQAYKRVKAFYKAVLSYLRSKGITKGKHIE